MQNKKTIESYQRQKMHLEALLVVIPLKMEVIQMLRSTKNEQTAEEELVAHFNLSLEQARYVLNLRLQYLNSLTVEDVQKKLSRVVKYLEKRECENQEMDAMGQNHYAENRKEHFAKYAEEQQLPIGGKWQGKGSYPHILKFEESTNNTQNQKNKYKVVCEKNILPGVSTDKFTMKDMHKYAHHLNSSQVLCYNFFRPLITESSNPTDKLIQLLETQGIKISRSSICSFEYCPDKEEKTQFDFHIQDGDIEVFFEIKYTEYGFGKAEKDDKHKEKFATIYEKYLNKQCCLKSKPNFDEFADHYQLYRNTIRITDKNRYVVLLYPEANKKASSEATEFCDQIKDEYKDNVLCLRWENIVYKDAELYCKYFAQ